MKVIKKLTFGDKVLLMLFAGYYAIPCIFNSVWHFSVVDHYVGDPNWLLGFFAAACLTILIIATKHTFFGQMRHARSCNSEFRYPIFYRYWVKWSLLLLFAYVSYTFSLHFDSSFRHSGSYVDSGFTPMLFYLLKAYHQIGTLIGSSQKYRSKGDGLYLMFFGVFLSISITGSFDVLFLLLLVIILLSYCKNTVIKPLNRVLRSKLILPLIPVLLLFGGLITKGVSYVYVNNIIVHVWPAVDTLVSRLSVHAYNFSHFVAHPGVWFDYWQDALAITWDQNLRRACIIFGNGHCSIVGNHTVSQLNRNVFLPHSDIVAGSSPGMFANLIYCPLSVFFLPVYLLCLSFWFSCLDRLMGARGKYQWPVYILSGIVIGGPLSSFMDAFNVFSVPFVSSVLIIVSSYRISFVNRRGGFSPRMDYELGSTPNSRDVPPL